MEALDLLRGFLRANGYDGLYSAGECACELKHLCTCDNPENVTDGECRPGVHQPVPEGSDWQFCIGARTVNDAGRYEAELARAAALLQGVHPLGQVKHIGLLEVSAALKEVLAEHDETARLLDGSCEETRQNFSALMHAVKVITELRVALQFYADPVSWRPQGLGPVSVSVPVARDGGEKARACLAKIDEVVQ